MAQIISHWHPSAHLQGLYNYIDFKVVMHGLALKMVQDHHAWPLDVSKELDTAKENIYMYRG